MADGVRCPNTESGRTERARRPGPRSHSALWRVGRLKPFRNEASGGQLLSTVRRRQRRTQMRKLLVSTPVLAAALIVFARRSGGRAATATGDVYGHRRAHVTASQGGLHVHHRIVSGCLRGRDHRAIRSRGHDSLQAERIVHGPWNACVHRLRSAAEQATSLGVTAPFWPLLANARGLSPL
jgi:hypothetical protein